MSEHSGLKTVIGGFCYMLDLRPLKFLCISKHVKQETKLQHKIFSHVMSYYGLP
jgi:hypothetical protein